jgi:Isochorismatase family
VAKAQDLDAEPGVGPTVDDQDLQHQTDNGVGKRKEHDGRGLQRRLNTRRCLGDELTRMCVTAQARATGRRKLIFCALWTEICMAFPALDALREGYEVYTVVDAIGGTSVEAHRAGLERVVQAGGKPISWVSLACELQRDWARQETVQQVIQIVLTERLLRE